MARQLIAGIFLLAFVMQTFSKPFILLDYYANTAAFAKNCINKSRPKMHCNGKCQLIKKLQEEEKKDQKDQDRKADNKVEIFSSASPANSILFPVVYLQQISYPDPAGKKPVNMPRVCFHPPAA